MTKHMFFFLPMKKYKLPKSLSVLIFLLFFYEKEVCFREASMNSNTIDAILLKILLFTLKFPIFDFLQYFPPI